MKYEVANDNESLLWDKFLSGDDDAYACIYRRYVQTLFSNALQFTTDRELIKDCIQDVFEKLHRNRHKLKPSDNVRVYLYVILKNSLINALKKERTYLYYIGGIESPSYEIVSDKLEEKEEKKKAQVKIQQIFDLLTPKQKEIIYYRYIRELDIKDIASITGMNYQSVQNVVQRSIKKIREFYLIKKE